MNAVMYGAGNIGRGFIGALLSQAGYRVQFVDVAEAVVTTLQQRQTYPVRYVSSQGHEDVWVENVTAVNGNDGEAVAKAIAECEIMATAVGARILKFIVPNIVAGLRLRWQAGAKPLNIIICENLMDANKVLEGMLKARLTQEECALFDETVGLVEASIGRMVPIQTEEMKDGEPLRVCVERYGFLPVDKDAFKGDIPEIPNLVPASPFDFYIKRKLYVHNMGHAVCAYLGGFYGNDYIWQSIEDPDVLYMVHNAMLDSAVALSGRYGVDVAAILNHVTDLLGRFRNRALMDTCQRVGGDPARKLAKEDRLIGSSLLAMEQGITPVYGAVGAAGAVYRYLRENDRPQDDANALAVLAEVSGLEAEHPLVKLIMEFYPLYLENATPARIRQAAQNRKTASLHNVI